MISLGVSEMNQAEMLEATQETLLRCTMQSREQIEENPVPAALTTFGIGLGLGLLASSFLLDAMRPPPPKGWSEQLYSALRHATPDSFMS